MHRLRIVRAGLRRGSPQDRRRQRKTGQRYILRRPGGCIGECPEGALSIEEREADPLTKESPGSDYPEKGEAAPAHLHVMSGSATCPGSTHAVFERKDQAVPGKVQTAGQPSELTHWPVQLHPINPAADFSRAKMLCWLQIASRLPWGFSPAVSKRQKPGHCMSQTR